MTTYEDELVWASDDEEMLNEELRVIEDTNLRRRARFECLNRKCQEMIVLLREKSRNEFLRARLFKHDRTLATQRCLIYRGVINYYTAAAQYFSEQI